MCAKPSALSSTAIFKNKQTMRGPRHLSRIRMPLFPSRALPQIFVSTLYTSVSNNASRREMRDSIHLFVFLRGFSQICIHSLQRIVIFLFLCVQSLLFGFAKNKTGDEIEYSSYAEGCRIESASG